MWRGYEECEVPHISRTLLTFFVPIVILKFFLIFQMGVDNVLW